MWNMKCMFIPVIIGATGIVTKGLKKNLEAITGKHSIYSLQKTAVLGTSHIIRNVLQSETLSLSGGDHRWFKRRSTREKRPVTGDDNSNSNNNLLLNHMYISVFIKPNTYSGNGKMLHFKVWPYSKVLIQFKVVHLGSSCTTCREDAGAYRQTDRQSLALRDSRT